MVGRGGRVPGAAARVAGRHRDPRRRSGRSSRKPRTRYVYYPGGAEIPESVAPNIRNRSYTIAAEVELETPEAGGVIFSQGSRFGGHALYVSDGKLKYVYNFDRRAACRSSSRTRTLPTGHVVLSASFEREGDAHAHHGHADPLHRRPEGRRSRTIRTQPGKFGLGGGGLVVGRSGAEPVTTTTPASGPGRSSAARSSACVIDVSGEPFVDLAREAQQAFARQ